VILPSRGSRSADRRIWFGNGAACRARFLAQKVVTDRAVCRRSGGSAEGWDVAGGHPRFLREAPMPLERLGVSRHRSPPRDLVDFRTARKGRHRPGPADAPTFPSGSTAKQALGKDARQVEASAGCGAYTAGRVSAEDSAILTVAGACDGTTAGLSARRAAAVPCNQFCAEPDFLRGCCQTSHAKLSS
jgi:hypothetical protein